MTDDADQRASLEDLRHATLEARPGAREALAKRLRQKVHAYVGLKYPSLDAEDLSQDVVADLLLRLERFEGEVGFERWALGFVANHAKRARRKAWQRQQADGAGVVVPRANTGPQTGFSKRERALALGRALAILPTKLRRAAESEIADESALEFAKREGISSGTARSRRHRARQFLRRVLDRYLHGEPASSRRGVALDTRSPPS